VTLKYATNAFAAGAQTLPRPCSWPHPSWRLRRLHSHALGARQPATLPPLAFWQIERWLWYHWSRLSTATIW